MTFSAHDALVSVVMPVYNGAAYLREAIDSVLTQTHQNFELIIINDGSIDESATVINSYKDDRIKVIHSQANLGANSAMSQGVERANGRYIARMDQDDISTPDRLSRQVAFLEQYPDIGACGSWVRKVGRGQGAVARYPTEPDAIKCWLLFRCVINNPASMVRRDSLAEVGLSWRETFKHAYDYALWVRLAKKTRLANIPDILLHYRIHPGQTSLVYRQEQLKSTLRIQQTQIRELGIKPTKRELELHLMLGLGVFEKGRDYTREIDEWLIKLKQANDAARYFPELAFADVLRQHWF